MNGDVIPTNSAKIIPDAGLYEFGVLTSNVHMAWMRAVYKAVMQAYGFSVKDTTEESCVAELMKLYQQLAMNKK